METKIRNTFNYKNYDVVLSEKHPLRLRSVNDNKIWFDLMVNDKFIIIKVEFKDSILVDIDADMLASKTQLFNYDMSSKLYKWVDYYIKCLEVVF